ncbi:ABC-type transport system, involved in lipoprotein release, permease component [Actinacidiphila yanglinensis]|uniref:ABC-type transport system, involved in lipoprotein release, permease component n=1 Tax=Actinacidiphila yanglinensis TaxID=310779 RepID=A0A1H5UUL9_9ACTN|nr:ABC transporter permease [Actinacidiphila yanglinensis]SEF78832.1 ABC-type transport system, involved in lipoprotein release, permease component [Actinacidiphila yanglinensis]
MFFTYLRRELRRRRKAALVVALGLALGIGLVITVDSVSSGMDQAQGKVLKSLYGLGTDMTVTKAAPASGTGSTTRPKFDFDANSSGTSQSSDRVMVQGFQTLSSSVVSTVGKQKDVAGAVGGLNLQVLKINGTFTQGQFQQRQGSSSGGGFPGGGGSSSTPQGEVKGGGAQFDANSYTLYGVDVSDLSMGPLTSSKITSGSTFTAADANAKVMVADSAYAKQNKLKVGSTVTVKGTKYKVIGIATADSGDAAANLYLPLKQAQTLSSSASKITTVYVKASDSQQISTVKSEIQHNISGTTVTTSADLASTVSGSLSTASSLATNVGKWLSIAVLIAAFLVAGLLTSSAVSRRVREFGTLKALGWKSGRVTRQVMGEALVNGLIGGALGIALGLAGAFAVTEISPTLSAQLGSSASTGGGQGGPGGGAPGGFGGGARQAASKTLDVALSAPVSVGTIVLAVGLALGGGLIAGTFGGWRASRLRPADALRRVE